MSSPLDEVCCARLPSCALAFLADLRGHPEVRVHLAGTWAWLRWRPGDDTVLRRVLPVAGVELYEQRNGHWYRHGWYLPTFTIPEEGTAQPLYSVILPAAVQVQPASQLRLRPDSIRLVPEDRPRPATALRCDLATLAEWADRATTAQLEGVEAALSGQTVVLLGRRLPALTAGQRFWGERLLVPLGWRCQPDVPADALCTALDLDTDEWLLLSEDAAEVLPRTRFAPLTRAGVRLACQEQLS